MREISVIVPVYNAEQFLSKCIESVLGQEEVDFELILVAVQSNDHSGEICDSYAEQNGRIKVIRQENKGISAARNLGMEMAEGKYFSFVDSDDYLPDVHTLKDMVQYAETGGADVVTGNYSRLWNGTLLPAAGHHTFSKEDVSDIDFRFKGFFSVGTLSYVWGKVYRRSFLEENHIAFADYSYAEDKMFNLLCYIKGAAYGFCERQVYVYRKNDNSVSFSYRQDSEKGWMRLAQQLQDELECTGQPEKRDLVGNIIFFACFFDAKMEYEFCGKKVRVIKNLLRRYAAYPLAGEYFRAFAKGKYMDGISSNMWKIMLRGFSAAMYLHLYGLLSWGIRLLIDWKIDERLSDTGKRRKNEEKISNQGGGGNSLAAGHGPEGIS